MRPTVTTPDPRSTLSIRPAETRVETAKDGLPTVCRQWQVSLLHDCWMQLDHRWQPRRRRAKRNSGPPRPRRVRYGGQDADVQRGPDTTST